MTEELIQYIHERPVLWSAKHPLSKSKIVICKTWEEIQALMPQFEVEELKRKWRGLRDTYRKELKKATKICNEVGFSNCSSWQYYNQMSFLREQILQTEQAAAGEICISTPEMDEESGDSESANKEDSTLMSNSSKRPLTPTNEASKRRRTREFRSEYLEIEKRKLKLLEKELNKNQNSDESEKSEDYHFLMSLLPQMERLGPLQKLRLRNKFNLALMEELNALKPHVNAADCEFIKVDYME